MHYLLYLKCIIIVSYNNMKYKLLEKFLCIFFSYDTIYKFIWSG